MPRAGAAVAAGAAAEPVLRVLCHWQPTSSRPANANTGTASEQRRMTASSQNRRMRDRDHSGGAGICHEDFARNAGGVEKPPPGGCSEKLGEPAAPRTEREVRQLRRAG